MRLDTRMVLVGVLLITLTLIGCTRSRLSEDFDAPAIAVAAAALGDSPDSLIESEAAVQGIAHVSLEPASTTIAVDETVAVNIQVADVTDLFGADVRLEFDSAILEVVDANTLVPGTQITPGDFPDISGGRGFVADNSANNASGTIGYAMTLLSPVEPASGTGTLASIIFRAKAPGTSDISFTSVLLSDPNANQIPTTRAGTTISVTSPAPVSPTPTTTPTPIPIPISTPSVNQCLYVVKPGDTLFSIASRFNVTVSDIAQANGITDVSQIFVGQRLVIPNCQPGAQPTPVPPSKCFTYVVKPGDTLFSLARRFNTTVSDIALRNHIVNPSLIFVGQKLTICPSGVAPPPSPPPQCVFYVVKPGDTLFSIALRFGSTVPAIARANNILNPNLIFIGQTLCIPQR